jgi:hypothetical protein
MAWGLLTKDGILYEMEGEFYTSKLTLSKTDDGDFRIPPQPHTIIFDVNGTAPVPSPNPIPARKTSGGVLIEGEYWKQTDNYRDAQRTCFSSSMAMITEKLNPPELEGDDEYVQTVFSIGDTTDPSVQVEALSRHGINGTYSQTMDFDLLDSELYQGYLVGVAILHRGPLEAPTGGHWIVCNGRSQTGDKYRFHDPYGSLMDGYQGDVENGKNVWYSRDILKARWTADGPGSGWGMTCRQKK